MEELLLELLGGEFELEILDDWLPIQEEQLTWWDRYWWTGETHL